MAYEKATTSRSRTRMTRIGRIFTDILDRCASVSSALSVFYRNPSAFIIPKPCGFSTLRTRMLAGISRSDIHVWQRPYVCATSTGATVDVGHALQRRDSGRHHLQLISFLLNDGAHKIRGEL